MSIIVETSNINSLQNGYNPICETTSNKNKRNLPPLIDMLLDSLIAVDFCIPCSNSKHHHEQQLCGS